MGLISLPAMMRAGYDPKLACGFDLRQRHSFGPDSYALRPADFMGDMIDGQATASVQ